jgi:DNA-binding transcriptional LysR family regulator
MIRIQSAATDIEPLLQLKKGFPMNMTKLKSLMHVAELGSLTAASNAVHLSQAAVSQHLKDLEVEFGMLLIDRSRRPVTLTKEGEDLVAVTRQMLQLWNEHKERNQKTKFGGNLVLGHVRSAITGIVANALIVLRAKHPKLTVRLVTSSGVTKYLAQEVVNRKIDASFGVGPFQLPEELLWRPYRLERYYVIAPKKYRGKTDEELLCRGPYLRHKPRLLDETRIDREMKRRGIRAEPSMEFDSYENILLMVEHDVGIGIVPDSYLSKQKFTQMHCVTFGTPPLTREMGLMVRHDSPNLCLVDLLWEAIKESSR